MIRPTLVAASCLLFLAPMTGCGPKAGDRVLLAKSENMWSEPNDIDEYFDIVMPAQWEGEKKLDAAGDTGYHEIRYLSVNFLSSHARSIHDGATVQFLRWAETSKGKRKIARVKVVDDAIEPSQRRSQAIYRFAENGEMGWVVSRKDSPL